MLDKAARVIGWTVMLFALSLVVDVVVLVLFLVCGASKDLAGDAGSWSGSAVMTAGLMGAALWWLTKMYETK